MQRFRNCKKMCFEQLLHAQAWSLLLGRDDSNMFVIIAARKAISNHSSAALIISSIMFLSKPALRKLFISRALVGRTEAESSLRDSLVFCVQCARPADTSDSNIRTMAVLPHHVYLFEFLLVGSSSILCSLTILSLLLGSMNFGVLSRKL